MNDVSADGKKKKKKVQTVNARIWSMNQKTAAVANANPFDRFANSKKKHEVINRKVKGEDRNVERARDKAIDERKKKLLKDYHSNRRVIRSTKALRRGQPVHVPRGEDVHALPTGQKEAHSQLKLV
jgi:hypothetical protein